MREIRYHKIKGESPLQISAVGDPGPGGANHLYHIGLPKGPALLINFQNGPIPEVGVNGITNEALLAIVIDRLEKFQEGPFECNENSDALYFLRNGLASLQERTEGRMRRGVEGKLQP